MKNNNIINELNIINEVINRGDDLCAIYLTEYANHRVDGCNIDDATLMAMFTLIDTTSACDFEFNDSVELFDSLQELCDDVKAIAYNISTIVANYEDDNSVIIKIKR